MKKTKTTFEGTVELVFLAFTNVSGLYTVMMIFSHQEAGDNFKNVFFKLLLKFENQTQKRIKSSDFCA